MTPEKENKEGKAGAAGELPAPARRAIQIILLFMWLGIILPPLLAWLAGAF